MTIKFNFDLMSKEPAKPFDDPDHRESLPEEPESEPESTGEEVVGNSQPSIVVGQPYTPSSPGDKPARKTVKTVRMVCEKCKEEKYLSEVLFWDTYAFGKLPETKEEQVVKLIQFLKSYVAKDNWIRGVKHDDVEGVNGMDYAYALIGGKEVFEFLDGDSKLLYIKMGKLVQDMISNKLHEVGKKYAI